MFSISDGSIKVHGDLSKWKESSTTKSDFIIYDHSKNLGDDWNCVYKEAMNVVRLKKEAREVVNKQMKAYRQDKFPKDYGLIVSMIMGRPHMNEEVINFNNLWWEQICKYSKRDQLSFDYLRWKTGIDVSYAEGDSRDNLTFKCRPHATFYPNII